MAVLQDTFLILLEPELLEKFTKYIIQNHELFDLTANSKIIIEDDENEQSELFKPAMKNDL